MCTSLPPEKQADLPHCQFTNQDGFISLGARSSCWSLSYEHLLAADTVRISLGAPWPTFPAWLAGLAVCRLFHAGRFERRSGRQVLQARDLVEQVLVLNLQGSTSHFGLLELIPQLGHLRLEGSKPLRQIDNEPAQGVGRQRLRSIVRKRAHALWNQTSATGATIMPENLPQLSPMPLSKTINQASDLTLMSANFFYNEDYWHAF
ncbi:hypothetical protein [Paracoccus beibuensis]|uniref:hypothetical protein n=1 Tax=Paracoccus beibuensis TaxID=547602 RepID=UPI00223FB0E7|nr:hypothetical protein [Paracoccus beibuensis]